MPAKNEAAQKQLAEIMEKLEQGVKDVFTSENYRKYLQTMSRFHRYSFNNIVLISMQRPDATLVAGYQTWKKLYDRQVMQGEKGIRILAPTPYKAKRMVEKKDSQGNVLLGKDGKPITEEKEITIPRYKAVPVFDISQTEGRELPMIGVRELTGEVGQYEDFYTALEKTSPVPMTFEKIEDSAHGYHSSLEKRIVIDEGMSQLQNIKTAIHEIAHAKLHNVDPNAPQEERENRPDRRTREVQAESVAYVVCQHYGIDTSDYSFGYIAGWSSGRDVAELKKSLETIQSTAAEIIESIDGHFTELQKLRAGEPIVTIIWSEHERFHDGEKMGILEANKLFKELDEANLDIPGYFKTKFRIDYMMNGVATSYEGRQDLGDGEGPLIDHIKEFNLAYLNDEQWKDFLLRTRGQEGLEEDKMQLELTLNEVIPYFTMHCNLSEMERVAGEALQNRDNLTSVETAYHTAIQAYVAECRGLVNQGEYNLPPVPQLRDFDLELQAYKEHVEKEIEQEAKAAGMTVEEYAANGYESYSASEPEAVQTAETPEPEKSAAPQSHEAEQTEKAETTVTYYPINEAAAKRAKQAISFSDYKPGSATAEYRHYVDEAAELAARQKRRVNPSFHEKIDGLLDAYARKLAANMNKGYEITARVPSIMIVGGSNFPVRKKEKQNAAADKNMQEFTEIQGLLDKIRSTGMGGISADDPNAVSKLESKLAKLEQEQETMKAVNAYYRKNKTLDGCPNLSAERIEAMKADMSSQWHIEDKPYPSWALSNNNAEIRRIKGRIAELTRKQETAYAGWKFDGGKVEANREDNRLQIFFEEKPDEKTREALKENGFRWSPKAGAWQRQLNDNAIYAADRITCIQPLIGERPTELQKRARQSVLASLHKNQEKISGRDSERQRDEGKSEKQYIKEAVRE